MRRRDILGLLGGLGTLSTDAVAQAGPVRVLAYLHPATPVPLLSYEGARANGLKPIVAFFDQLRRSGFVEGQNLVVRRYSGEGQTRRYPQVAGEAVAGNPDAIFTLTTRMVGHLRALTTTIPIVAYMSDPVANGYAASLARPGSNVTGVVAEPGFSVMEKRFEMLREVLPQLRTVAVLAPQPTFSSADGGQWAENARRAGITLVPWGFESHVGEAEYERLFQRSSTEPVDAVLVIDAAENFTGRATIIRLARARRILAVYPSRAYAEGGGMIAFGPDYVELHSYAAGEVAKIFAGTPPAEIPFYQPQKFEVVLKLKAVKDAGLILPASLLARADEVIE